MKLTVEGSNKFVQDFVLCGNFEHTQLFSVILCRSDSSKIKGVFTAEAIVYNFVTYRTESGTTVIKEVERHD